MGITGIAGLSGLSSLVSKPYSKIILGIEPASLIAYWPMNETVGPTADNAEGTAARDGTYVNATPNSITGPEGSPAPRFDGTGDLMDFDSASFTAAFDTQELTITMLVRVFNAGVWTDGATRYLIRIRSSSTNQLYIRLPTTNNTLTYFYRGTQIDKTITQTDWFFVGMTVTISGNSFVAYAKEPSTSLDIDSTSGMAAFTGALDASYQVVGAEADGGGSSFNGYIAHVAIWDSALSQAKITKLAKVIK